MTPGSPVRWLIALLCLALVLPTSAIGQGATPVEGETRLFIGHVARVTARIPADWTIAPGDVEVYGGETGLFTAWPTVADSLSDACEQVATGTDPGSAIDVRDTTWHGGPACAFDVPPAAIGRHDAVGLVIPHAKPFPRDGEIAGFVVLVGTGGTLESILSTLSFDVSTLTGSEIAHSVVEIAQAHSYYTDRVNWDLLREAASGVGAPDEVDNFIRGSLLPRLRGAGDNHSFLVPAQQLDVSGTSPPVVFPTGEMRGNLGYLVIPTSPILAADFAPYVNASLTTIADLSSSGACGWIIDLRGNMGGSAALMLQALTPLFPQGDLVGFVPATGDVDWVSRQGDEILFSGVLYGIQDHDSIPPLANPSAPVAVLIDWNTSSAAEITLLALTSLPNALSFGQPTGGYTVGNSALYLLDGSVLALAAAAAIDTEGNVYTREIQPDAVTYGVASGGAQGTDSTIMTAETWLLEQPGCQVATPAA